MKKQVHVLYAGRVQGVGFRYTAREVADEIGVTGWAKNLSDGRVELVAEAQEEVVKDFLERIARHFRSYIQNEDASWSAATGEFKDFGIRF
jgi:acylphosphatase